ncbi:hypothetical protein ACGFZL_01200 [Streptomyces sp. NPDC048182]|uniref:hypothetical protein n=1 Tax=unclassified Streptomyces TaxID=2593676 RepID=UPI0033A34798
MGVTEIQEDEPVPEATARSGPRGYAGYATPLLAGEAEDDGVEPHIWRGTD